MFEQFAVFVNLVEKDDNKVRVEDNAVVRIDEHHIELRAVSSDSIHQNSKIFDQSDNHDSNVAFGAREDQHLGQSKSDPKKVLRYKFKNVLGPKADHFKLNQAIRFEPEIDSLTTMISIGRYHPIMLHLKEVSTVKGQLAFVIQDIQFRSGEDELFIQTSVFSFNKGELIDLLATDKTQMLFGFELSYIEENRETVSNLTSKILSRCSKKLRDLSLNPPSIFFYVTFQLGASTKRFRYLLCDVYNPYQAETSNLCMELQTLLKYVTFETSETEILEQEQTSSVDIFFNELVQEHSQRLSLMVCIPTEKKHLSDAVKLSDFALKLEKASRIFESYTFRVAKSGGPSLPRMLSQRPTSGGHSQANSAARERPSTFDIERPAMMLHARDDDVRQSGQLGDVVRRADVKAGPDRGRNLAEEAGGVSEMIQRCVEHVERRNEDKDRFIEIQSELLREHLELTKLKMTTNNSITEELDRLLESERYQTTFLKNLIRSIAEYKWLKDEQKKVKIVQAINELGDLLGDKTITCLMNLLVEPSKAT
jgi:hypothetical protein